MSMRRSPLTLKGAERLRNELKKLKTEDRPRVIQAIAEARSVVFGVLAQISMAARFGNG